MGHCVVYTLANVLNDGNILKYLDKPEYKGCNEEQANKMLEDCGCDFQIRQVAGVCTAYTFLPTSWVYDNILKFPEPVVCDFECMVVPYLLTVSLVPGIYHYVAALSIYNRLFYLDPYNESWFELESAKHFDSLFLGVQSVDRFVMNNGTNKYCVLSGEGLGLDDLLKLNTPNGSKNGL